METVGILSILEGEPYKRVKALWKLFGEKYNSVGVQTFDHPNITFQGGKTSKLMELEAEFETLAKELQPFQMEVDGLGHFNRKAIYPCVKKDTSLVGINEMINDLLKSYCEELFRQYYPENWVPHVTVAMQDLIEDVFDKAWHALGNSRINFKQTIHQIRCEEVHTL